MTTAMVMESYGREDVGIAEISGYQRSSNFSKHLLWARHCIRCTGGVHRYWHCSPPCKACPSVGSLLREGALKHSLSVPAWAYLEPSTLYKKKKKPKNNNLLALVAPVDCQLHPCGTWGKLSVPVLSGSASHPSE